jgi:PAS domain-containing protein
MFSPRSSSCCLPPSWPANAVSHGNLVLENLQAQLKLERQTEIISLLLKEFQENASDWLWQTDAEGRLIYVPERFVEVAQIPLPLLKGVSFSDVLEMLCPGDVITTSNIAALMKRREPLHEMSIRRARRRRDPHLVVDGEAQPRRRRPVSRLSRFRPRYDGTLAGRARRSGEPR